MTTIRKNTRVLFFTTSPRTPNKMIPEIILLTDKFDMEVWNQETQASFAKALSKQDFFEGSINQNDPALSARDRITRAPKALGFVDLKPTVSLTAAGEEYTMGSFQEEALLRQLLKFQLPSPYHKLPADSDLDFFVKPYLEIIRLVRHFGTLSFDELMLFGLQLTSYNKFEEVVSKIEDFRTRKALSRGNYRQFFAKECEKEIKTIYQNEIQNGQTNTRESRDASLSYFIKTKKSNMRDYADACFRYLRATEIVSISQKGHSLSIPKDRIEDVDFILETVPRNPIFIDDEVAYKQYLFDSKQPMLYSDDRDRIANKVKKLDSSLDVEKMSLSELKDKELVLRAMKRLDHIEKQVIRIKDYREYDNIQATFDGILNQEYYDNPLMFEWNTWRAVAMMDGGIIEPSFKLDDEGQPLSTAAGNMADITCDYDTFRMTVEVTLQSGQKQYDNEGEPVARHLGKFKELTGQETYCLFIAPTISEATIAHFYALHKINIQLYGGKAVIVPMELAVFRKMIESSYKAAYVPLPEQMKALFAESIRTAESADNETEWYESMRTYALGWPYSK